MPTTNRNPPSEKERSELSLVTYLPIYDVATILRDKYADGQILYAAYICHDCDDKETHTHIYVRFSRSRKSSQIVNWFRAVDDKGLMINTFAEPVHGTVRQLLDYFVHKNAPEKHQYGEDQVFTFGNLDEYADTVVLNIFDDLIAGTPIRQMVAKYGKDFVYHYASWRAIVSDYNEFEKKEK